MTHFFKSFLDSSLYLLVDILAIIASSIDFLIDVVQSRGRPQGTLLAYVRQGRNHLGWFLFILQLSKKCPNVKLHCFLGDEDLLGNSDDMPSELRHAIRNRDQLLDQIQDDHEEEV
ncbi:hypothetical protein KAR91_82325 [Candidatus Pacearchaeota archaeon]|nr:hypothetical protein [Candidatus Pacearchaeota archaeon]